MPGKSAKSRLVTIRLPNEVMSAIERRAAAGRWVSPSAYIRERVIYDTLRKHRPRPGKRRDITDQPPQDNDT